MDHKENFKLYQGEEMRLGGGLVLYISHLGERSDFHEPNNIHFNGICHNKDFKSQTSWANTFPTHNFSSSSTVNASCTMEEFASLTNRGATLNALNFEGFIQEH